MTKTIYFNLSPISFQQSHVPMSCCCSDPPASVQITRSAMLSVQPVTQNSYAGDTPNSQTDIALRNSLEASGKALTLAKTCRFVSASVRMHVQPDEDFSKLYHILVGSCAGLASPYKRCQRLTHLNTLVRVDGDTCFRATIQGLNIHTAILIMYLINISLFFVQRKLGWWPIVNR